MPGPITQMRPGWSTPAGIRLRIVFSPSTTSVCPALLPPWKRTTTSASAASRSTIFPFPSSPHWVPVTTTAGTETLQPQHVGRDDLRELPQLGQHLGWHRIVDVDQGDRHAAHALAAELEAGDVDAALAEERADPADDARHVAVVQHQDVPLGNRLHAEAVDLGQADRLGAERRAPDGRRAAGPAAPDADRVQVVARLRGAGLDHLDASLAGERRRVHVVDARVEELGEEPAQRGGGERP